MNFEKILVVDDIDAIREIIIFYLQTILSTTNILEAKCGNDAAEVLRENPDIQLVISEYNMPNGTGLDVFKASKSYTNAPFILHTTDSNAQHQSMFNEPHFYFLPKPMDAEQLELALKNITKNQLDQSKTSEYVPVKLSLVKKMKETRVPLYLKISDSKYVKLLNKGEVDPNFLSEKTGTNEIRTLFIKKEDVHNYIDDYHNLIQNTLDHADLKKNMVLEKVLTTTELLSSVVETLHISEKISNLVHENIQSVTELAKDRRELKQIIEDLEQSDSSARTKHIVLLSMISTEIAISLHWATDVTSTKLTYAAILHDCFIDEHARFCSNNPSEHILKAVKLAENWKNCPADVSNIIQQHHERPDGTGFPNNLDHHRITPLSAVFIVANDLTESILKLGKEHMLESWLFAKEKEYSAGNFKKAFEILRSKSLSLKVS